MITYRGEPQQRSGRELMCLRHTHGQVEISPSRAYCSRQADESDGGGQCVEQVLSMEIADSSAQNEGGERKEEVEVEDNWSEASRNQLTMRR